MNKYREALFNIRFAMKKSCYSKSIFEMQKINFDLLFELIRKYEDLKKQNEEMAAELEKCKNELLHADYGSILVNKAIDRMKETEELLIKQILKIDEEIKNGNKI